MTTMATINRRVAAKISRMTANEAKALIAALEPKTIEQPIIRELTGGYASQSINATVIRRLAVKSGYVKNL